MTTLEIKGSIPAIVTNKDGLYDGDLVGYFRAVFNHAENLCNPYHNFRHMCHVLWLCYEASVFYVEMSSRDMRNLLIAALFHDFDHTGRSDPDAANIKRAIDGLRRHLLPEDKRELGKIEAIIRATEFPYRVSLERLDLQSQIIRDADMSQALTVAWIQQVVFGLATEWKRTPLEVLRAQDPFHRNLKLHTAWARQMFPQAAIESKIAEANELVELLSGEPVAAA
ncbi:MAG: hypothetical protein UY26_C0002G0104 [Candidatus Jorgensenbacteria bacterium GW2011_GWA1_48_13]|uniref:PDEase domain-containing protein n=2 Tax=Candidatus Joergenseniibacteriota TaxID=1752739 RepID=A0A0G1YK66_9BACT|nr:MAG: hypothetical protein UY26_C0002G0104 [Candidatus Jorgensenbacteria bacterium GW2011_GWA1_48_13]KKU99212.1 MAG: hypothetical protein UY32_C0004G0004 [Candidatus Jorgensenbacteria bacterium GW2011_GWC1_48_8]KKW15407.1 MAG: hypothetical protein UY55_C0001G0161 [Candidatus Jorgensenbacteria bacterium GW2011_GWB1_50_10]